MLNKTLLREDYAQVATFSPNTRYLDCFEEAQEEACEDRRGIWGLSEDELCRLRDRGMESGTVSAADGALATLAFGQVFDERRGYSESSSFKALSINSMSSGFKPPPAKWPHTPGITRSSAFGMRFTAYSSSSGGK